MGRNVLRSARQISGEVGCARDHRSFVRFSEAEPRRSATTETALMMRSKSRSFASLRMTSSWGTSAPFHDGVLVSGADFSSRAEERVQRLQHGQLRAVFAQGFDYGFCRNISNQVILREGTSAETADGGIEAATAGFIGRDDFRGGLVGAAVQVDSYLEITILGHHSGDDLLNLLGRRYAYGIGKGDRANLLQLEQANGFDDLIYAPVIAVGIAEGHRDVDDSVEPRFIGLLLDLFQFLDSVFQSLPLIVLQKCGRDRIRKTQGAHRLGRDRPLSALFIDHDTDDFHVVGRIEFLQNLFGVGHLWDSVGRNEADGVNVLEAGRDQGLEIVGLQISRDLAFESLPRIAGALDQLYGFAHAASRNLVIGRSGHRAIGVLQITR